MCEYSRTTQQYISVVLLRLLLLLVQSSSCILYYIHRAMGVQMQHQQQQVPVEVYGFLGWITSSVLYLVYIVWACTPDAVLHWHGITYYPSKYWAIAIPTWLCVSLVMVYYLYLCLNGIMANRLSRMREPT